MGTEEREGGGSETAKNDDQLTKIAKVSKFLDQIGEPSGEKLDPRYGRWKSWRETANLRILQVSENRGKKERLLGSTVLILRNFSPGCLF